MATIAQDSFTDTAGTAIHTHTPEAGGPWIRHTVFSSISLVISDAGRARNANVSQTGLVYATTVPSTNDVVLDADLYCVTPGTTSTIAIVARLSTSTYTGYEIRYTSGTATWELCRLNSSASTVLASASQTLTAGTSYHMRFICSDAAKVMLIDGIELGRSTDNTITAGRAGFRSSAGNAASDAAGIHLDNYVAADYVPPAAKTVFRVGWRRGVTSTTGLRLGS